MDLITAAILGIIVAIFAKEAEAWLPWLTERILCFAIRQLPHELRSRCEEEWRADLRGVPGKLGKLFLALGLTRAAYSILLQKREDSEHQQNQIRVGFAVAIFACVLLAPLAGYSVPILVKLTSMGYLACALSLLGHVLVRPEVKPRRRYAGMLLDHVTLSIGMIVGGALVAPLYPMYLWITFGMGFRYGTPYLFRSAGLSVAGFTVVVLTTPYWSSQPILSGSLLLALVVLPAYVSRLVSCRLAS